MTLNTKFIAFHNFFQVPAEVSETPLAPASSETSPAPAPNVSLGPALSENVCLENDIGLWPEFMTPCNVEYCIKMGVAALQNCDGDLFDCKSFKQSDRNSEKIFIRKCQTSFFYAKDTER